MLGITLCCTGPFTPAGAVQGTAVCVGGAGLSLPLAAARGKHSAARGEKQQQETPGIVSIQQQKAARFWNILLTASPESSNQALLGLKYINTHLKFAHLPDEALCSPEDCRSPLSLCFSRLNNQFPQSLSLVFLSLHQLCCFSLHSQHHH